MELFWLATLSILWRTSEGARILILQPLIARGHSIVMEPLYEELAARGHQVTLVTSFPHKYPIPNLREIDVSHNLPVAVSNFSLQYIKEFMSNPFKTSIYMAAFDSLLCEQILSKPSMKSLFNSTDKYELVMTEIFVSECFIPFAHKFKAPLVSFVTSCAYPWVADRVGLPDNPSYIPNYFVNFSTDMNLYERIQNTIVLGWSKLVFYYNMLIHVDRIVKDQLNDSLPLLHRLISNTSLILVNSHISLSQSRPFPPNVVEMGGIHIRNTSKSLTKDFQEILDKSTQGAILMSFGSMVRASSIPRHIILMFMNVFSTIPQTVIFKYEEELPEAPPNVIIRKWLPQREIIEHKNVKLLLAHGGLASTIESVYFAKPFIGVPFFADQYLNVKAIVRRGAGLMLALDDLSEQIIKSTVLEVLSNSTYSENMKRLSLQFRDRPMTPLQTAVYWTEYVIRHQGAPHLRPASVDLPFYQYLLLDVIAVLLVSLLVIFYLVYYVFFRIIRVNTKIHLSYKFKKDKLT